MIEEENNSSQADERYVDPVTEFYKKDVDVTAIDENLKLTPDQRLRNLESFVRDLEQLQRAMKNAAGSGAK